MEGAVAKNVRNSIEEAKKSVILYRVPLWFDFDNFTDVLGEDLASYRRFTKKGSAEETETLELKFYIAEDASKHIRAGRIMVGTEDDSPSQDLKSLQDHRPQASSRILHQDPMRNVCWKSCDQ